VVVSEEEKKVGEEKRKERGTARRWTRGIRKIRKKNP